MLKLRRSNTVGRQVKVRLPTENPNTFVEGTLTAQVRIKTKDELKQFADEELSDAEYVRELVASVEGLGDEDGNAITGDKAIDEVVSGPWSNYLTAAILQDYFEQFGEARVKNSKPSRRR